tara:strand:+ start:1545 stop:2147 length:603 start_codon:yes stop_codon:yes gene_type:complete
MIKATIIITNYNYEKWLRRCIRSCLNQSLPRDQYEVIVVDDSSTDNSKDILLDYKDEKNFKVIFNQENRGVGYAANKGSRSARGKWIVRVDADDYVHFEFLNFLLLFAESNKSKAVASDYVMVDFDENVLSRKNQEEDPIACAILYRTDVLEYIGSWSVDHAIDEDKDIHERYTKNFEIDYLEIPLYRYFKHKGSLSCQR